MERQSFFVIIFSISAPLVIAALTLYLAARNRNQHDRLLFQIKAAEIVMDAGGADAALNRAKKMVSLFPEHLPQNFATSFNAEDYFNAEAFESKVKFFEIVAPQIDKKEELGLLWGQLFPKDKWTERIE